LSRATFEEAMLQLITATVFSECDKLNSVSSNIVIGSPICAGTGMVNLVDIPVVVPALGENDEEL